MSQTAIYTITDQSVPCSMMLSFRLFGNNSIVSNILGATPPMLSTANVTMGSMMQTTAANRVTITRNTTLDFGNYRGWSITILTAVRTIAQTLNVKFVSEIEYN
ncbi:unnamed protein product [Gordionus sp. m RMFG-2023]